MAVPCTGWETTHRACYYRAIQNTQPLFMHSSFHGLSPYWKLYTFVTSLKGETPLYLHHKASWLTLGHSQGYVEGFCFEFIPAKTPFFLGGVWAWGFFFVLHNYFRWKARVVGRLGCGRANSAIVDRFSVGQQNFLHCKKSKNQFTAYQPCYLFGTGGGFLGGKAIYFRAQNSPPIFTILHQKILVYILHISQDTC